MALAMGNLLEHAGYIGFVRHCQIGRTQIQSGGEEVQATRG